MRSGTTLQPPSDPPAPLELDPLVLDPLVLEALVDAPPAPLVLVAADPPTPAPLELAGEPDVVVDVPLVPEVVDEVVEVPVVVVVELPQPAAARPPTASDPQSKSNA